ncbi:MAG: ABC transporter ATP-binding protein [Nitriliruptorales bacterium]|nr:ABC transporter ATP-binding protein [Nitriliruptorales bacterium]
MAETIDQTGETGADASAAPPDVGSVTMVLENVDVTYRVYADRRPQIKDLVKKGFRNRDFREIRAVQNISFEVREGEAVGLVGRNGSGKSTLLQAMAGLLPVDGGQVYASAQPTLLGVGAALNAKVSGRRNIELGLLALGIPGDEVQRRIPDIIDFSGLNDFIDLPLTAYSSGMKARLHFSIATAVQPEILLIDEALAVGDRGFKRKSERRIEELLENAGTVFLVSHSEGAIRDICNRCLWIDQGEMQMDGDVEEVLEAYEDFVEGTDDGEDTGTTQGFSKEKIQRRLGQR